MTQVPKRKFLNVLTIFLPYVALLKEQIRVCIGNLQFQHSQEKCSLTTQWRKKDVFNCRGFRKGYFYHVGNNYRTTSEEAMHPENQRHADNTQHGTRNLSPPQLSSLETCLETPSFCTQPL